MEDGRIEDFQITASSSLSITIANPTQSSITYEPKYARLNGDKYWAADVGADSILGSRLNF